MSASISSPLLSRHTAWILAICVVGAIGLSAVGCHNSAPSLLLLVEDSEGVAPQQLRVTVSRQGAEPHTVIRPEAPGAPLPPGQSLRLFFPTDAMGQQADLLIEGLVDGSVLASGRVAARVPDDGELEVWVVLHPNCTPESCPQGCCREGVCGEREADGSCEPPGPCAECDPLRSDHCEDDRCRCGEAPACDESEVCRDGACVTAEPCEVEADCAPVAGMECVETQQTCESGICVPVFKDEGAACEDGNLCTGTGTCDGQGRCTPGEPLTCTPGSNPCLIYSTQCSPVHGCNGRPVQDGSPCPGGSPCAPNACVSGQCVPNGPACDPGQYCCPDHPQRCHVTPPGGAACFMQAG